MPSAARPASGSAAQPPALTSATPRSSLEQFTIDGVDIAFERQADDVSQVYVVDLGEEAIRAGKPVVVAFRFRTRTRRNGHAIHVDVDRPTRGLEVEFHYGDADVAQARMLDFASIGEGGRTDNDPDTQTLRYRYDDCLFPRAGLAFSWTLPKAAAPATTSRQSKMVPRATGKHSTPLRAAAATRRASDNR